ncbi:MAG: hypothetical protein HWE22_17120 [Flavobacteriales bacterium]|nr:hypothetical protein [Flavobacteriales bacterium]
MKEIIANRNDLTFPEDFYEIAAECRESKYFLDSLEVFATEHIVLPEDHNEEKFYSHSKRIKDCQKQFEELEKKVFFNEENTLDDGRVKIDAFEIIDTGLKYIRLKEQIDQLQVDILEYQYEISYNLLNKFVEGKEYLKVLSSQYRSKSHLFSAFTHSRDEDKFDNYRITFKNKGLIKEYSKKNEYPIRLKVRNHEFLLNKWREQFKTIKQSEVDLIIGSSRLEEEQEINKISLEQHKQSKKLNRLNVIAFAIAVIGLAYGTISTFYLIRDQTSNTTDYNPKIIEQLDNIEKKQSVIIDTLLKKVYPIIEIASK